MQTEPDPLDADDPEEVIEDTDGEDFYPVEYSISSYGADYPVDGLVKRITNGSIYIPKFQRGYVWNIYRASRFVESLLLGLPVPAVFLAKDAETAKQLVIDGQQRLLTLSYFYSGVFEPDDRAFRLRGVQERFAGKTYSTLSAADQLRLDDSILHAIIIHQEQPDSGHTGEPSSVYHIFERLNTGGVLLHPQEIRTCICHGAFVELLESLNQDQHWRALFGKVSSRMRDRELILRFFALSQQEANYTKPMKEFLTRFLRQHRNLSDEAAAPLVESFRKTCEVCHLALGEKAFKPTRAVNAAVADSVMLGVSTRLKSGEITDHAELLSCYSRLTKDPGFIKATSSSTTNDASVRERIRLATEYFSSCP